jgi:hypothetical protein
MEKITVADLGVEGGGLTMYGTRTGNSWSFWSEGTSIALDENDDEIWKTWSSEPVSDLHLVVPSNWPLFYPLKIHPAFRGWFRENYDKACSMLREDRKANQIKHQGAAWREELQGQ